MKKLKPIIAEQTIYINRFKRIGFGLLRRKYAGQQYKENNLITTGERQYFG